MQYEGTATGRLNRTSVIREVLERSGGVPSATLSSASQCTYPSSTPRAPESAGLGWLAIVV